MDEILQEIRQDVKEIKAQVIEQVKIGAIHNHLLKEHERRSLALEALQKEDRKTMDGRFKPIELHVHTMGLVNRGLWALALVLAGGLLKYFLT